MDPCPSGGKVGSVTPHMVTPITVEPSKPRMAPPGPNFLWPVGTPKFPSIRVNTQGIWCIGSIANFRNLIN